MRTGVRCRSVAASWSRLTLVALATCALGAQVVGVSSAIAQDGGETAPGERDALLLAGDVEMDAHHATGRSAEELWAAGDFEAAAQMYEQLADQAASDPAVAAPALYNAALIHEQDLGRFAQAGRLYERLAATYPESDVYDDALERIVVTARVRFDIDRAVAALHALNDVGPRERSQIEDPLLDAAELLAASHRYPEAADAYGNWLDVHPDDERAAAVAYALARTLGDAEQPDEMVRALEAFVTTYGDAGPNLWIDVDAAVIDALSRLAAHHAAEGRTAEAAERYEQIVREADERQPAHESARAQAAEATYALAMNAFDTWEEAIALAPGPTLRADVEELLAEGAALQDRFDAVADHGAAEWTVCALSARGQVPAALADRVRAAADALQAGDDVEAGADDAAWLHGTAEQLDASAVSEWQLAINVASQLRSSGRCTPDIAIQLYRTAGESHPLGVDAIAPMDAGRLRRPPAAEEASAADAAGMVDLFAMLDEGRDEAVVEAARAMLDTDQATPDVYRAMGVALARLGQTDLARYALERGLDDASDPAAFAIELAWLELAAGEPAHADRWAQRALAESPDDPGALAVAAASLAQWGPLDDARELLMRAHQSAPDDPTILLWLGDVHRRNGWFDEAREAWQRALELNPAAHEAQYNLGLLYLQALLPDMDDVARYGAAVDALTAYRDATDDVGDSHVVHRLIDDAEWRLAHAEEQGR